MPSTSLQVSCNGLSYVVVYLSYRHQDFWSYDGIPNEQTSIASNCAYWGVRGRVLCVCLGGYRTKKANLWLAHHCLRRIQYWAEKWHQSLLSPNKILWLKSPNEVKLAKYQKFWSGKMSNTISGLETGRNVTTIRTQHLPQMSHDGQRTKNQCRH